MSIHGIFCQKRQTLGGKLKILLFLANQSHERTAHDDPLKTAPLQIILKVMSGTYLLFFSVWPYLGCWSLKYRKAKGNCWVQLLGNLVRRNIYIACDQMFRSHNAHRYLVDDMASMWYLNMFLIHCCCQMLHEVEVPHGHQWNTARAYTWIQNQIYSLLPRFIR